MLLPQSTTAILVKIKGALIQAFLAESMKYGYVQSQETNIYHQYIEKSCINVLLYLNCIYLVYISLPL